MKQYTGIECPICQQRFTESDDIVVCPDCGAPYHRACIKEKGQCAFADQHGGDFAWQPPQPETPLYDGEAELRCSRCGTINPSDKLFCEVCGNQLNITPENISRQYPGHEQNPGSPEHPDAQGPDAQGPYAGPFGPGGQPQNQPPNMGGPMGGPAGPEMSGPFRAMPYNPFTTPFGGLNPDEEIDGIPVKDLAMFLGQNSHYFLPKFKQMKTKGSNSWNWSACFLRLYYCLYRKMWGLAAIGIVLQILLSLPSVFYLIEVYRAQMGLGALFFSADALDTLSIFGSFLTLIVMSLFGLFTNRIYMHTVFKRVRKIRAQYGDTPQYHEMLLKGGYVSKTAVIVALAVTFLTSFASAFIMLFMSSI